MGPNATTDMSKGKRSLALAKLRAKFPNDDSQHWPNQKMRIDGTTFDRPIDFPKKSEKPKGKKGTKVPLDDDDYAPITQ